MAAAFYVAQYEGIAGSGGGAFYIGNGVITGVDGMFGVYNGEYVEQAGRLNGTASLGIHGGGVLVTGRRLADGETVDVTFSLPSYFANGEAHPVQVDGQHVNVLFTKIRDIP